MEKLHVALAGNPNCGKSTVFNGLTGGHQHVGNWPGKTVARKEGFYLEGETKVLVVDLPGTYSLSAYSPEEEVARDYIVQAQPDVVVNVLDAANLERNLYLTAQILETGAPLVVMLNMSDLAARRGYCIDAAQLSQRLGGAPVVVAVANRGEGLTELRRAIQAVGRRADGQCESQESRESTQTEEYDDGAGKFRVATATRLWRCH